MRLPGLHAELERAEWHLELGGVWRRLVGRARAKGIGDSTWLDNTKAKFLLAWRPRYDTRKMADAAFNYVRRPDDPRKVWYPG